MIAETTPFAPAAGTSEEEKVVAIALAVLDPHPKNRKKRNGEKQRELTDSMRETGQIQPAIVRPKADGERYEIIAGEGRWTSARELGWEALKCIVRPMSDALALEHLLLDNVMREDLSPLDEARVYQELLQLKDEAGELLYSRKKLAEKVLGSASREARVRSMLALLNLPEVMMSAVEEGKVKPAIASLVAKVPTVEGRDLVAQEVLSKGLNWEATRDFIAAHCVVNLLGAPFSLEDAVVFESSEDARWGFDGHLGEANDGSCMRCPWRVENNEEFRSAMEERKAGKGGVHPKTCLRPQCYAAKVRQTRLNAANAFAVKLREAAKGAFEVILGDLDSTALWFVGDVLKPTAPVVRLDDASTMEKGGRAMTWGEVLEHSTAPREVWVKPESGTPFAVVEKALALQIARDILDLAEEASRDPGAAPPAEKVIAASRTTKDEDGKRRAEEKKAQALEKEIKSETAMDALREMEGAVRKLPASADFAVLFWKALVRMHPRLDLLGHYFGAVRPESELEHELREWPHDHGTTTPALTAMMTVALCIEDVKESGAGVAEDFGAFCELLKIDVKQIEKRVRKAHELAAKQAAKPSRKPAPAPDEKRIWECEKGCGFRTTDAAEMRRHECKGERVPENVVHERAADLVSAMVLAEVTPSEPNEFGVYASTVQGLHECRAGTKSDYAFAVGLALGVDGAWYAGVALCLGIAGGSGGMLTGGFQSRREALVAAFNDHAGAIAGEMERHASAPDQKKHVAQCQKVLSLLEEADAELGRWETPEEQLERPALTLHQASADATEREELKQRWEALPKKPGRGAPPEERNAWDAERKRITRAAEKLKLELPKKDGAV